jgi:hypothetical protein
LTSDFLMQVRLAEGLVQVGMSRAVGVARGTGSGSILLLNFRILSTAIPGSVIPIHISEVKLRGEFGQDFEWYGTIGTRDGSISVNSTTQSGCCCLDEGDGKSSDAPLGDTGGDVALTAVAGVALLVSRRRKP